MASTRKYTSEETKELIQSHKKNIKQLENCFNLSSNFIKDTCDLINEMASDNVFKKDVMDSLNGSQSGLPEKIEDLICNLYLIKRSTNQSDICKSIIAENKERIEKIIKTASIGTNSILWLFSSAKKKQLYENAVEELKKELSSPYWSYSQKTFAAIKENDSVTVLDGINDYTNKREQYKRLLECNLPSNSRLTTPIEELSDLTWQYKHIRSRINKETEKTEGIKDDIKKSAERLVMETVLSILKTVPVEEINRNKKGFRVKSLRDYGYCNMADVYAASESQLASVNGISWDAAYSIKTIAKQVAIETKHNAKIKLSVDNKTKSSSNLVVNLYKYKQYLTALTMLSHLEKEYSKRIDSAIDDVDSIGSGIYWNFIGEGKRDRIKSSFSFLSSEITGNYKSTSDTILSLLQRSVNASEKSAWEDFGDNSIQYFNILEEIVPGVLGNDDQLYGLPEDLAREIQDECFFPDGLNCELRRYQEWGVKYILHQERVLLGDEMGLGKTIQAIAAMVSLKNTGATHFIVVCPASVLPNWCKEIATKSKLSVTKVHGTGRNQAIKSWIKMGGVAVTTYETTGIFKFESGFSFDLLVVDEAHFIKNENAVRSKNARALSLYSKRILFMTGTALENNVNEMISLINVLQPDVANRVQSIAFMASAPQFREKIAGVYYRRKREDVLTELPDLIESKEWCTMGREERIQYENTVLEKNYMGVRRLSWDVDDLALSCKAKRMKELVEEAESEGRKVLVFSFFLDTIRKIHEFLGDRCCNPINGSINPQRRQEIIDEFNDDEKKTVLCAQIQSGGTGLNIQAASVVIICEPQLKPSIENQAISRAYRMGQARNVLVYRLLCEDTIDERITNLLERKQEIFDAFADKSVAAEKTEKNDVEVDESTFGKIIEEEIERIKAKEGIGDAPPRDESMFKKSPSKRKRDGNANHGTDSDFVSKSAVTTSDEYSKEINMDYDELINHLLKKYGPAKGDYFVNENCVTKNKRITRTAEGLFCHHIDEDKAIKLSEDRFAQSNPFEYQKANRLVYCNILEHLVLHIKIFEKTQKNNAESLYGVGGALAYITKLINDFYGGYEFSRQYLITATDVIKDNFDDYILILRYFWHIIEEIPMFSYIISKELLCEGTDGQIVKRVYDGFRA